MTAACATADLLERLLAGDLSEAAAQGLREHLQECERCRAALDRLSDDPALPRWAVEARAFSAFDSGHSAPDELLKALRETPAVSSCGSSSEEVTPDDGLRYLGPPEQPGDLGTLGQYRVLAELGRGGMGIVLKAFDKELSRTVAVKVLRSEKIDERARTRFVREARAAAGLSHDHIVPVHAVVNSPGVPPYLVMSFIPGPTLRDETASRGSIEPRDAATICAEVAGGLAAAHRAGLVHRDIKPANIILDNEHGRACIVDFGLVRAQEQPTGTTQDGTIPGTPEYMSPEQIRTPDQIDARSDVYSLGVTLFEALTGVLPFRGTPQMVLQQALHDEPIAPRRLSHRVPRDLETICLKAIAKEPAHRYQTATEMRDDLRRWLGGEPIRARPVSGLEKGWRWCRRRPTQAALCGVLLLLTVAAAAAGIWYRHDRMSKALRRDQIQGDITLALREVDGLRVRVESRRDDAGRMQLLQEAVSALQRAQGLLDASDGLASSEHSAAVEKQRHALEQEIKDHRFVGLLQEIRPWRADAVTSNDQDFRGADQRYLAAFKAMGLNVANPDLHSTEKYLADKPRHLREGIATALDDWTYMRRQTKGDTQSLVALARMLDVDPVRNQIRAAQEKDVLKSLFELQKLARSPDVLELPAATVHLLALALFYRNDFDSAVSLLHAAQRRYPDDFQINHDLAWTLLYRKQPPQADQAVRFFGIALATRPQSAAARVGLANAFRLKRDYAEAIATLRELIRLHPAQPDPAALEQLAWYNANLNSLLRDAGKPTEVTESLRRAVEQMKTIIASKPGEASFRQQLAGRYSDLGHHLGEIGNYKEAVDAFRNAITLRPEDPYLWYSQGVSHLGDDDFDAHKELLEAMLRRFGATTDPAIAARLIYACAPAPCPIDVAERLVRLAEVAEPHANGKGRLHGAALFREGQFEKSLFSFSEGSQGRAWDWLFQAMAYHRLNKSQEAKQCLNKANTWISVARPHWTEQVESRVLLRQANRMLDDKR